MPSFDTPKQDYFPFQGGLDLLTPQISMPSGKVFDAQNYEPEIVGGYSRINGYERFDGRTSPSAAAYWIMTVAITGTIAVGNTITGGTSAATAKVLAVVGTTKLVLGRVVGTFAASEAIKVAAVTQATSSTTAVRQGESSPSNDADYLLLAANDYRADITVVPGSGPIRGVAIYNDTVYAFRDNAGATAGDMYKSTAGGWVKITFKNEFTFNTGTVAPTIGQTIRGATSGATGTVVAILLRTGSWAGTGVGSIVYSVLAGTFSSGEVIKDNALAITYCTTTSAGAAITRAPGGQLDYAVSNFTGSTATTKLYGADGVNPAFEFGGTDYIPIHTGMTSDAPTHIFAHKNFLWLSFLGSVQFSGLGNPYAWTVVLGAGEIALGEVVTGFMSQGGNSSGSSLAIFTKGRTYILYGASTGSFNLVPSVFDVGYSAFTMAPVSNNTYGLTARGIQSLITTLTYGDFDYSSVSHFIQPFMASKKGLETCATSLRLKDQYRLYFSDGTGIIVGLTGDNIAGLMPLNYGKVVRCITTATLSTGNEVTYFGSDDGYVYQDDTGTSFDGGVIESWLRTAFANSKTPRTRKRYRRAVFEAKSFGFSIVNISYELGYANPDILVPVALANSQLLAGGFWEQFTWDQFTWDTKVFTDISMPLTGTEKNISFLFYSSRAQDSKHTIQGATLLYSPQRVER